MGKETVTGTASPYTHSFAFDESTRTAQKTAVYVEDTEDMHYLVPDMAVEEVTITINDIGAVLVEAALIGTGYWTERGWFNVPGSDPGNSSNFTQIDLAAGVFVFFTGILPSGSQFQA